MLLYGSTILVLPLWKDWQPSRLSIFRYLFVRGMTLNIWYTNSSRLVILSSRYIIILAVIGLYIWYHLIQSAVEQSKMAEHIKEIRDILVEMRTGNGHTLVHAPTPQSVNQGDDTRHCECCPGCGQRVSKDERICPECGLTLVNS